MNFFESIKRSPRVFLLAIAMILIMALFSEVAHWRSLRTVDALTATSIARNSILDWRQSILVAQAGQRNYLATSRPEFLAPYNRALNELDVTFKALQNRYATAPLSMDVLIHLRTVTNALLKDLADNIRVHDTGQSRSTQESDNLQLDAIQRLSDELLELEGQSAAASQKDIYQLLMLNRIAVVLFSAISLFALMKYLRQSLALEQHQKEVQRMVQSERDRLEVEVLQRTAQLTELTSHLQTAREDERHRLARNLHDDLGALLTSAKLDAARIRSRLTGFEAAAEAVVLLAHLVATLNEGIELGRRIIEDLRPSALSSLGLVATLEILLGEFASHSNVQVQAALEPVELTEGAELMVYRLVQEAITNLSKHAKAKNVWVTLGMKDGQVEVSVRDDGVGFDTEIKPMSAYGLVGMRFRVEAAGGKLAVISAPGHGTLVQVRLPPSATNAA